MEIYKQCVQEHDEEFANCKTKLQIKFNSPNYKEFTKKQSIKSTNSIHSYETPFLNAKSAT